jgi:hypothetical protein
MMVWSGPPADTMYASSAVNRARVSGPEWAYTVRNGACAHIPPPPANDTRTETLRHVE